MKPAVGIIMGSDSDFEIMQEAARILKQFEVAYEIGVYSAHRSPHRTADYVKSARDRGLKVIIAGAGSSAHLAGVSAAETTLPVIGVPVGSSPLSGLDSLLSTVQMPPGVPVATMGIGKSGATNAALLAVQILALQDGTLLNKLVEYKEHLEKTVAEKSKRIESSLPRERAARRPGEGSNGSLRHLRSRRVLPAGHGFAVSMEKTYYIANFGCRASQSEGASIREELLESKATETSSAYDANVVIVNSCTVTDEADREVRQTIRRVVSRNPKAQIIVTGCYAQRAPEELAGLPGVRYVVGNSHKPMVGRMALNLYDEDFGNHGRAEILCSSIFLEKELRPASHPGSGGRTRPVVKVQDGCNANCSFCIIPSVRGRSRSVTLNGVLEEVRSLVGRDYKEVVLSGIHLGTYGRDLPVKAGLYEMVCRILEIPGLERLRLSSIEPLEVVPELIDLVASHPRMAHHLHIPLQSGSLRVLRAMRRPYGPEYYADLVRHIRQRVHDAAIGADVMVGFPGETDEDFLETYRLIEDSPLTYLHVFPYSTRPGTVAADLPNPIPQHVSRFRAKALRSLIAGKNETFRRCMVGQEIEALTLEDGAAISSNFVRIGLPPGFPVNEWIRVLVTGLHENGLQASRITTADEINRSWVSET